MSTQAASPSAPPKSARRRSREFALQALYGWLLNESIELGILIAQAHELEAFERADAAFFETLLRGVREHASSLRQALLPLLDRPLAELSPVEHVVLLIGAYELMHQPAVPYRVAINEAVELAKSFGGTDGFKYVNGVLDKLAPIARTVEVKAAARSRQPRPAAS